VTVDHVAIALSRLSHQFQGKTKIEAFLRALAGPANDLETSSQQLLLLRSVFTATGQALTDIGTLVGQPRNGVTDDELYRRYVLAKIATNRSRGTTEDMINIARLVLQDDDATIRVSNQGIAAFTLLVDDIQLDGDVADILIKFLRGAASAGVRPILEYSVSEPHLNFKFAGGMSTTRASYSVVVNGADEYLHFEAVELGSSGNSIKFRIVDSGALSLTESVHATEGRVVEITVDLGVTTIASVETLIRKSARWIRIKTLTSSAGTVDFEVTYTALSGGVNGNGAGFPRLARKQLNESDATTNVDTLVRSRIAGENGQTISFVADGAGAGTLTDGINAVFHYQSGVTTVANFQTALRTSNYLTTYLSGTLAAVLTAADDNNNPIRLWGGAPGGRLVTARDA
jgi:hypothetical protein